MVIPTNGCMMNGEADLPASSWRIHIVKSDGSLPGSGWLALMLRELALTHSGYQIHDCEMDMGQLERAAHANPSPASGSVTMNLLGVDGRATITPVAKFLRDHQSTRILNVVGSTRMPSGLGLLLRECGASLVIDSISSARIAARTAGRFFDRWPLSTNSPMLQQLPWSQYSRHLRSGTL